jgi:hypothetical protein
VKRWDALEYSQYIPQQPAIVTAHAHVSQKPSANDFCISGRPLYGVEINVI